MFDRSKAIRVFGYGRASTLKQQMTEDVQREHVSRAFRAYIELGQFGEGSKFLGWFYDEDTTSRIPFMQRPQGEAVLREAQAGDCIIVAKFDRIFRSVVDLCETMETLNERKLRLILLDFNVDTGTINGYGMMQMLAIIKWMEREACSERTREALAYRRANFLPAGKSPPGYKIVRKIINGRRESRYVPCRKSRELCQYIVHLKDVERRSFREIALALDKLGHHSRTGQNPSQQKVKDFYDAAKAGYPINGVVPDKLPTFSDGKLNGHAYDEVDPVEAAMRDV
jgi:DNA invertase Pin-like site-specific DNA recombinase